MIPQPRECYQEFCVLISNTELYSTYLITYLMMHFSNSLHKYYHLDPHQFTWGRQRRKTHIRQNGNVIINREVKWQREAMFGVIKATNINKGQVTVLSQSSRIRSIYRDVSSEIYCWQDKKMSKEIKESLMRLGLSNMVAISNIWINLS